MDYLPIFMDLRGRPCIVVGGGEVAARKVSLLAAASARITVVSPELCAPLAAEAAAERLVHRAAEYSEEDLDGAVLAIAATDDRAVNARVSADAQRRCIPVNAVDDPELCSFIMPAIVDRSPVVIAISTGGTSPVLARLMRGRLESLIPAAYGRLAALADRFRDRVKARFGSTEARRVFWEKVFEGPVAELVFSGRETEAEAELGKAIEAADAGAITAGEVYLVGAGPGNPDLLTFAALRLMQQADVAVHDALVSKEVLDLVRRDAERIYVGKRRADHALPQDDINHLLSRLAKEGRRVLRLKGGDPFVFGRGGEEIEHLAAEGIRFQVIPGITAATGCAAFAGIPLTHRDYAHACVFVTGHLKDGTLDLDWEALARPHQTVVVYMGLHGLESLCRELVAHGLPPATPAAMIEKGTQPGQRIVTGTLDTLHRLVMDANLKPPTLVIVGEVVRLREKLRWGG